MQGLHVGKYQEYRLGRENGFVSCLGNKYRYEFQCAYFPGGRQPARQAAAEWGEIGRTYCLLCKNREKTAVAPEKNIRTWKVVEPTTIFMNLLRVTPLHRGCLRPAGFVFFGLGRRYLRNCYNVLVIHNFRGVCQIRSPGRGIGRRLLSSGLSLADHIFYFGQFALQV